MQRNNGCKEIRFFIDSLLVDLESMEETQPKCTPTKQFEKPACPRQGFPANIKSVAKIGSSSLIIKWEIIDCENIKGYELFLDGYLSNRYHSPRHEMAVIADVDVDRPHKVVLLALDEYTDNSLDVLFKNGKKLRRPCIIDCNTRVLKCPPSSHTSGRIWVPSLFIYEPVVKKRLVEPQPRIRQPEDYCPIRHEEGEGDGEGVRTAREEEILPDYEEFEEAIVKQESAVDATVVKPEGAEDAAIVKQESGKGAGVIKQEADEEDAIKSGKPNESRVMEEAEIKQEPKTEQSQFEEDIKKEPY